MKIKKLIESTKLVEDDDKEPKTTSDTTLDEVNPQEDSVSDIANAVQGSVEDNGGEPVDDDTAKEIAKDIKDTAQEVDADYVEFAPSDDDYNSVFGANRLTTLLDLCLDTAKRTLAQNKVLTRNKRQDTSNVLIEGLPGSGKTSIVRAWARARGIVLVEINVTDAKLELAINGTQVRDLNVNDEDGNPVDRNKLVHATSRFFEKTLLNPEYEGKCVIFCDELNRQRDDQIRRPLLAIFADKTNSDGTLDFSKNLLFSIVCINPVGSKYKDSGVVKLSDAETNRFGGGYWNGSRGYDSNIEDAKIYNKSNFEATMLELGVNVNKNSKYYQRTKIFGPWKKKFSAEEILILDEQLRIYHLRSYILNHNLFKFDTRKDLDDLHVTEKNLLSSRLLTAGMNQSGGDPNKFLFWVENNANMLDGKNSEGQDDYHIKNNVKMFKDILKSYYQPSIEDLRAAYNIFLDADGNVISEQEYYGTTDEEETDTTTTTTTGGETTNGGPEIDAGDDDGADIEDDPTIQGTGTSTGTGGTTGSVDDTTQDIVASWGDADDWNSDIDKL